MCSYSEISTFYMWSRPRPRGSGLDLGLTVSPSFNITAKNFPVTSFDYRAKFG